MLKNKTVHRGISSIFQDVGICPQFDCLWPELSPLEHLYLFGRMKGLSGNDLDESVQYFIRSMQLEQYINRRSKNLSGGNKRKLCVSNALIGSPELLFFDEPSSGLDPIARRFLWNTLSQNIEKKESSIVLTTHSMNEADNLASKIGILINGQFVCLGSNQHLKGKYGNGYTLDINCKKEAQVEVVELVEKRFCFAKQIKDQEQLPEEIQFQLLETQDFKFSKVFTYINELKNEKLIEDFSLSQCSLEQVFIRFSKYQYDPDKEESEKEYKE
eukprot:TRINITY_DN2768_c0_g1_i4.p4 TRINITY_DN2768_c0_g1~~TRINITY_DN2768_c0_g1_i4.p4  ORF type:complete len:272 (+),score=46.38 TRINITY_DN2768_c0_g1_i4:1504-2319(+)